MKPGMKKCYKKFIAQGKHKKVALKVGVWIFASDKQTTFALLGLDFCRSCGLETFDTMNFNNSVWPIKNFQWITGLQKFFSTFKRMKKQMFIYANSVS